MAKLTGRGIVAFCSEETMSPHVPLPKARISCHASDVERVRRVIDDITTT
jgi:hypothetical protein